MKTQFYICQFYKNCKYMLWCFDVFDDYFTFFFLVFCLHLAVYTFNKIFQCQLKSKYKESGVSTKRPYYRSYFFRIFKHYLIFVKEKSINISMYKALLPTETNVSKNGHDPLHDDKIDLRISRQQELFLFNHAS